tara:strand:+ start:13144 stop:13452 length:309 start_codon:yes stop_codon:yes gene_type:complete
MPSYWNDDFEDFDNCQDWTPVVLKRSESTKNINNVESSSSMEIPMHRQVAIARSNHDYTQHRFAQLIHMKINDYIKYEKGELDISEQMLRKIKKYLNIKNVK